MCPYFVRDATCPLLHRAVDLTEPIDIYSEWIDAADAAERQATGSRPAASSSRHAPAVNFGSDDE